MSAHPTAVVGDVAAGAAAAVAALGLFHEYAFHEWVGTTAGLMAITYYIIKAWQWWRG